MSTIEKPTKVVTGKVRFSYVNVFEPKAIEEGQEPKYSVTILIDKSDKATIAKVEQAIQNALDGGIAKFGGKLPPPAKLKLPLRDGDAERPDDEAYAGMMFLNANCSAKNKPGVVNKAGMPIGEAEFYSGCYGRASLNFYAFNTNGNKGIACGLGNLMKMEDGENLTGRSSAEEDFKDFIETDDL